MIQVHYCAFFVLAFLMLVLPLDWIAAMGIASAYHELMHILAVYFLDGKITKFEIQPTGCVLKTTPLAEWKEFVSILAGPIGSFSLVFFCCTAPEIAICGLFQGIFNLIPVLPLDGGRMLRLLLDCFCPNKSETVMKVVAFMTCISLDILALNEFGRNPRNLELLLVVFLWNIRMFPRKTPCKPS